MTVKKIIFFDSDCIFCNNSVNLVSRLDKKNIFLFTSARILESEKPHSLDFILEQSESTILLYSHGRYFKKSAAVKRIIFSLGFFYALFSLPLFLIPNFILNLFYDFIAKNRHKIFTNKQTCSYKQNEIIKNKIIYTQEEFSKNLLLKKQKNFLTAKWLHLCMVNYEVEPSLLAGYVPLGTELDFFEGKCFVSLVCFLFNHTRIKNVKIPGYSDFEEINLRFYVKRKRGNKLERGVVFIKEFVPKRLISLTANYLYNENYETAHMSHEIFENSQYEYSWKTCNSEKSYVKVSVQGQPQAFIKNSLEEYIAEHYFGYARQRNGATFEYGVEHVPWHVWTDCNLDLSVDFKNLYGEKWAFLKEKKPTSVFVANGSAIQVLEPVEIYF